MKKLFIFLALLLLTTTASAGYLFNPHTGKLDRLINLNEDGGAKSIISVDTIVFPTGSLTDNCDGTVSYDTTGVANTEPFITYRASAGLTAERSLVSGDSINFVDNGTTLAVSAPIISIISSDIAGLDVVYVHVTGDVMSGSLRVEGIISADTLSVDSTTTISGDVYMFGSIVSTDGVYYGDGSGLYNIGTVNTTALTFNAKAGEAVTKGQAVYLSGATGANPIMYKADNTSSAKCRVVGIASATYVINQNGTIRRSGTLTNVDTLGVNDVNPNGETWAAGDLLFAMTSGGLTNIRPTSGRSVKVAYSLKGSSDTDTLLSYPLENPVWATCAAGENNVLRIGDSVGANRVSIRNYANIEVASIDSVGHIRTINTISSESVSTDVIQSLGGYDHTILFGNTNDAGTSTGDGYRIRYEGDFNAEANNDFLIIEKTDGNDDFPDGGIVFMNKSQATSSKPGLVILGDGKVGIGTITPDVALAVVGAISADSITVTTLSAPIITIISNDVGQTKSDIITHDTVLGIISKDISAIDALYVHVSGDTITGQINGTYGIFSDHLQGHTIGTSFLTADSVRVDGNISGDTISIDSVATVSGDIQTYGTFRTGAESKDGQVYIYSEQGGTDYAITLNPSATMTKATTYTLPVDDGGANQALITDGDGLLSWGNVSASPAGSDQQVQINDGGGTGAEANFSFDKVTDTFRMSGFVSTDSVRVEGPLSADNVSVDNALAVSGDVSLYEMNSAGVVFNSSAGLLSGGNSITDANITDATIITQDVSNLTSLRKVSVNFFVDGGGEAISVGPKSWIRMPYNMKIQGWELTVTTTDAGTTGSITINVMKDTYANYPPTSADTICGNFSAGSFRPYVSSDATWSSNDTTLTGWTVDLITGDYVKISVDTVDKVGEAYLTIYGYRE